MHKPHLLKTDELYHYLLDTSLRESDIQAELRQTTIETVAQSQMMAAAEQAQFLSFLVSLIGAERAIEVGVYTGYGSLAIAQALPQQGELIACDINKEWTDVAQPFWQRADVAHKIRLKLAPALETLKSLLEQGEQESFDFIFVDADKINYLKYYELGLQLIKPGRIMIFDNVLMVSRGLVHEQQNPTTKALYQFNQALHHDARVDIALLSVGEGMLLVRKK